MGGCRFVAAGPGDCAVQCVCIWTDRDCKVLSASSQCCPLHYLFRIYYFKTNTFERRPVVFGVFTRAHAHAHIHHADIQTDVLTRPVMMCGAVKPGGCWNTQVLIHYWKRKTKKHHFTLHPSMGTLLASSCCWLTARIPTRKMWAGRCLRT